MDQRDGSAGSGISDESSTEKTQRFVDMNRRELGPIADELNWLTPQQAVEAEARRNQLLDGLGSGVVWDCADTKPHWGPLSPGCRHCIEGDWSCLFINELCNCRCFYCPTAQDRESVPMTQTVAFDRADDFADYVARFGFRGVSLSGGEPLMTLDRTTRYLQKAAQRLKGSGHRWLYTNGTLVTQTALEQLKAAGLDEIRFDISANAYRLDKVAQAAGIMEWVTVEIPAVPEDVERLKALLPELSRVGVSSLNLHQLRVTPHNVMRVKKRPYTFLPAEHPLVLESELAALDVLGHASRQGLPLSVNYCAFGYKHRFQAAAARRRSAAWIVKPCETLTQTGHIRTVTATADPDVLQGAVDSLTRRGVAPERWSLSTNQRRLVLHPETLWALDSDQVTWTIAYDSALIRSSLSYRQPFVTIALNGRRSVFVERSGVAQFDGLQGDRARAIHRWLQGASVGGSLDHSVWQLISPYEAIVTGLAPYHGVNSASLVAPDDGNERAR